MVLHCPVTLTWAIAPGTAMATIMASIKTNRAAPEKSRFMASCFKKTSLKKAGCCRGKISKIGGGLDVLRAATCNVARALVDLRTLSEPPPIVKTIRSTISVANFNFHYELRCDCPAVVELRKHLLLPREEEANSRQLGNKK